MHESTTHWIHQLKAGNPDAAEPIWSRYHLRLVQLARKHLAGLPRAMADEEDVVQSAFDSFYRGAELGRFAKLDDSADLWQLLVVLTARKAVNRVRYEKRQKRGGKIDKQNDPITLEQVVGNEPTPEFCAEAAETYRELLEILGNEGLQSIAVWKMEGYTNAEIAQRLGCTLRTVERKLRLIRQAWSEYDRT